MTNTIAKAHFWRVDITGLRALAVIPVLLFHAWPELLPGGFFGVDVFFVISGYLISGIIFRGLAAGNFSFWDFYVKRIRRILPNLILLLIVVLGIGAFVLTASEYGTLGKHVYSSAFFYQNFRLLGEGGYFDVAGINKPLLHIWSLSIEEQFYLLFPLLCALAWRIGGGQVGRFVKGAFPVLITVGSFAYCLGEPDDARAFYFPLTRFWELGVGICLAYAESIGFSSERFSRSTREAASIFGLLAVLWAVVCFNPEWRTPGIVSLPAVIGAAFLILAGPAAFANRTLLSSRPMIFTGLASYSLYLWHWPALSFLHIALPTREADLKGIVLLGSCLIAIAVWKWVENPFRRASGRSVTVGLLVALLMCFGAGQTVRKMEGFPERSTVKRIEALLPSHDWNTTEGYIRRSEFEHEYWVLDPDRAIDVLLFGDSHAMQYSQRLRVLGERTGLNVAVVEGSGCLVVGGIKRDGTQEDERCRNAFLTAKRVLEMPSVRRIVMGGIWGRYLTDCKSIFTDATGRGSVLSEGGFEAALRAQRVLFESYPEKRFWVLLDAPWDDGDEYGYEQHIDRLWTDETRMVFDRPYPKDDRWRRGNEVVESVFSGAAQVMLVRSEPHVCKKGVCDLRKYRDDDHLHPSYLRDYGVWLDVVIE